MAAEVGAGKRGLGQLLLTGVWSTSRVFVEEREHTGGSCDDRVPVSPSRDFVVFVRHLQISHLVDPSSCLRNRDGLIGVAMHEYYWKIGYRFKARRGHAARGRSSCGNRSPDRAMLHSQLQSARAAHRLP